MTAYVRDEAELYGLLESSRDIYRLCYLRGPEGIVVELAERIGKELHDRSRAVEVRAISQPKQG